MMRGMLDKKRCILLKLMWGPRRVPMCVLKERLVRGRHLRLPGHTSQGAFPVYSLDLLCVT